MTTPINPSTAGHHPVAFAGFSAFERSALAIAFRLSGHRPTGYCAVPTLAEGEFVVADADHPRVIDEISAAGLLPRTVFIGAQAPEGAGSWMMRPIDPHHVLRELDLLASRLRDTAALAALAPIALAAARPEDRPAPPAAGTATAGAVNARTVTPQRRASDQPVAPPARQALIIDDSEVALRWLDLKLQQRGLGTRLARTSQQALAAIEAAVPDFVFLDLELGNASELDGLALCRELRRRTSPRAPVLLIVSAHNAQADRVRGTLAGCDAYLGKPLDGAELDAILQRHGVGAVAPATLTA